MEFCCSELAELTGGRLVGEDVTVVRLVHDSREAGRGDLFVPIVAERDGHDFVAAAVAAGAVAYLTAREPRSDGGASAIVVADTQAALTAIGSAARRRLPDRVVGITGSVGKTTVKDLIAAVLGVRWATAASMRSFNNELGVPLTLANAPAATEAAVVEMGARGIGHITELCEVARPHVGIVTTVGMAHTELFGTVEAVARAKGELVEALPCDGVAVLNADVPLVDAMAGRSAARVLRFGYAAGADVTAVDVVTADDLTSRFELRSPWGSAAVSLPVHGAHNVANALAAAAAALALGLGPAEVAEGLGRASLSPWRMEVGRTAGGTVVVNDAYNANPVSMVAALESLARLPARRRVAVLGPMAELGDAGVAAHRDIGRRAAALGVEVVAVGTDAYATGSVVPDLDAACEALGPLGAGDAILVKASRVAGLERLAGRLLAGG